MRLTIKFYPFHVGCTYLLCSKENMEPASNFLNKETSYALMFFSTRMKN